MRAEVRALEIEVDDLVPRRLVHLQERPPARQAGVCDEDVDASELARRKRDEALVRRDRCKISVEGDSDAARGPDPRDDVCGAVGLAVVRDDDGGARAG